MKRLTFLAGLLGLPLLGQKRTAAAGFDTGIDCTGGKCDPGINQPTVSATCDDCIVVEPIDLRPRYVMQGREIHWYSGKALNNQCPTCGTMAAPYKRSEWLQRTARVNCPRTGPNGDYLAIISPCTEADAPAHQDVACERCNTMFRQRVE